MELKRKLIVSFMLVIMIPVIMVIIMGKAIVTYQLNSIQKAFDLEVDTAQIISNPIQLLNQVTRGVYNRIAYLAEYNPEKLADMEYIDLLNNELDSNYSFIAVRRDNVFIYTGNERITNAIQNRLPAYGKYHTDVDGGVYISGRTPTLIKQQDFLFSDGEEGTVFVITDLTTMVPQIKSSAIQAVIAFASILVLTAVILSAWLYGSIIRPLNKLKTATRKMKEGDLDFTISGNPEDEIGQLCEDFEKMRAHLKELLEDRLRYEQETSELISNISHDLKTPLTAIKGYSEGIIDGVAATAERKDKYIRTIYTKANDMSVLVDELALYSKIDCNEVVYNFVPLSVAAYFDDCIEELTLDLEVKELELSYQNGVGKDVQTLADPEQLKRVITNIIGNSVKYTDRRMISDPEKKAERGKIDIQLYEQGEYICIKIGDNGSGIPPEDLTHIFERFYRADAARSTKNGGSGLGLSIAKKIVEDHEGHIRADSTLGVGTVIEIKLKKMKPAADNTADNLKPVVKRRRLLPWGRDDTRLNFMRKD